MTDKFFIISWALFLTSKNISFISCLHKVFKVTQITALYPKLHLSGGQGLYINYSHKSLIVTPNMWRLSAVGGFPEQNSVPPHCFHLTSHIWRFKDPPQSCWSRHVSQHAVYLAFTKHVKPPVGQKILLQPQKPQHAVSIPSALTLTDMCTHPHKVNRNQKKKNVYTLTWDSDTPYMRKHHALVWVSDSWSALQLEDINSRTNLHLDPPVTIKRCKAGTPALPEAQRCCNVLI